MTRDFASLYVADERLTSNAHGSFAYYQTF
jgi:hypothetical protein